MRLWRQNTRSAPPLPRILYDDAGVKRVIFELPPSSAPERDSVLAFAMPKSGSVLLEKVVRELAEQTGLAYVSIMGHLFKLGLPPSLAPKNTSEIFLAKGYCYGGFRGIPRTFEIPIIGTAPKILLVRDPRDMLVSHYFSIRESHPLRGNALTTSVPQIDYREFALSTEINDYVKDAAKAYKFLFGEYEKLRRAHEVRVFRYEDVIFDKPGWIDAICAYFAWDVPARVRLRIAAENDQQPQQEETANHVRQVRPGDHKRKLTRETIVHLNEVFAEELQAFGYEHDVAY